MDALVEAIKNALRIVFIWICGVTASGLVGMLLALSFSSEKFAGFTGFIAGSFAFACLRLWIGDRHLEPKPSEDQSENPYDEGAAKTSDKPAWSGGFLDDKKAAPALEENEPGTPEPVDPDETVSPKKGWADQDSKFAYYKSQDAKSELLK